MKKNKLKTLIDFARYDASEITDPKAKRMALIIANMTIAKIAMKRAELLMKEDEG